MVFEGIMDYGEMQKIHTYLNLKYGIGIQPYAHLHYPYLSHPHHISGLGRDIRQCLYQTRSQAFGDILIGETLAQLHHGDILVWGHDNQSIAKADSSLEVPSGIAYRMQRTWRIAETRESDSIRIAFDLQGTAWESLEPRALVLLVDDDADFTDARVIDDPLDSGFRLDLEDGQYLSLGVKEYVKLEMKAILAGAWDATSGLMRDDLREQGLVPLLDPYEQRVKLSPDKLSVSDSDAIVDWVEIRLYDSQDSSVLHRQAALLQADGDIVGPDSHSSLLLNVPAGEYFVGLSHRNHLSIMSAVSVQLDTSSQVIDFISGNAGGDQPQQELAVATFGLWPGDANQDQQLVFQGSGNDVSKIFLEVLSAADNTSFARDFVLEGYWAADLNLDGKVVFQGAGADVSLLFLTILSHSGNAGFSRSFVIKSVAP
ncbi:MAG: hypothetical protein AAGM67_00945 [Bacteroidota bacterium]